MNIDNELKHVYQVLETPESKMNKLYEEGIRKYSDLFLKRHSLAKAELNVRASFQKELAKVVDWAEAFEQKQGVKPNIHRDFSEDAFNEFDEADSEENNELFVNVDSALSLKHVCEVLELPESVQGELREEGVRSYDDLLLKRHSLAKAELHVKPWLFQKALAKVVKWAKDFEQKQGKEPCNGDLTKDALGEFDEAVSEENNELELELWESMFEIYKFGAHLAKASNILNHLTRSGTIPQLLDIEAQKVVDSMTPELKDRCKNFPNKRFARRAIEAYLFQSSKTIFVDGEMQSGKSAITGLVQTAGRRMHVPLVIITKGVAESRGLCKKLKDYSKGTEWEEYIVVASQPKGLGRTKQEAINAAIAKCGILIVADTAAQIGRAIKAIKKYREGSVGEKKFALLVDECDAMYRTHDCRLQVEKAYRELLEMNPCVRFMVSATLHPVLLDFFEEEEGEEPIIFDLDTDEDYVGLADIVPLEVDGEKVFLDHGSLSHDSVIPYFDEKVEQLCDDALFKKPGTRGVLVLICTCPRVRATGNVKEQADGVQKLYRKRGKDIVVLTYTGSGIELRYPNAEWKKSEKEIDAGQRIDVGEVIQEVDDSDFGLDIPVFVFGFSKIQRGTSFRSNTRVPTHLAIMLGTGHNGMNVVQAKGRGCFIGKHLLKSNGFKQPTILTTASDYAMALKLQKWRSENRLRRRGGESWRDAFNGAKRGYDDGANFVRHLNRELGQRKGQKKRLAAISKFEEPTELSPGEIELKKKYRSEVVAQRLMRVLLDLFRKDKRRLVHADSIDDAYNDTYDERILKKDRNSWLGKFKKDALVEKDGTGSSSSWRICSQKVVILIINWELARTRQEMVHEIDLQAKIVPDDSPDELEIDSVQNCLEMTNNSGAPEAVDDSDAAHGWEGESYDPFGESDSERKSRSPAYKRIRKMKTVHAAAEETKKLKSDNRFDSAQPLGCLSNEGSDNDSDCFVPSATSEKMVEVSETVQTCTANANRPELNLISPVALSQAPVTPSPPIKRRKVTKQVTRSPSPPASPDLSP